MSSTTQTETPAADRVDTKKIAPRSTKRRMAREPKAGGNAPSESAHPAPKSTNAAAPNESRGPSKIAAVISLLHRTQGATLAEMVEATRWLPHTTRAALTGLKKKGHIITKDKRGQVTCYRIAKASS